MWLKGRWCLAALLYSGLIVYVSLFPLTGWRLPRTPLFSFLAAPLNGHVSRADLLTNVLAYAPLGALFVWSSDQSRFVRSKIAAAAFGILLSFTMESLQMFLPARTPSNVDLAANVTGTLLGTASAGIFQLWGINVRLNRLRISWIEVGNVADTILLAAFLWILAQLSPFVPSMDVSSVRSGLAPLWHGLHHPQALSLNQAASYTLNITGLALLVSIVALPRRPASWLFLILAGAVLCAKPFIVSRSLSLEALVGFAMAAFLLQVVPGQRSVRLLASGAFIIAAFAVTELAPVRGSGLSPFHWIPLAG
jgi:VanZ family protein